MHSVKRRMSGACGDERGLRDSRRRSKGNVCVLVALFGLGCAGLGGSRLRDRVLCCLGELEVMFGRCRNLSSLLVHREELVRFLT